MSQGLAISVRQPFAWAIVAGIKPIENRGASVAGRFRKLIGQRIAIHAAFNMADAEYEAAVAFMRQLGVKPPHPDTLWYGGVVGSAEVVAVVTASRSPWFSGPAGIEFAKPIECEFFQCRGWPGVFNLGQSARNPPARR